LILQEVGRGGVNWVCPIWDRAWRLTRVSHIMKLWVQQNLRKFPNSRS